ncbi:18192_t:CDS:10 [Cetraspora pellucida]|uniref:18192_t:CDS:1 n=1 Tax=Cetraspora pellucida TaxID=1433469 RepID=A0ACA9KSU6_9GLOM|nr:18192_t:CDS:10 [Cetraspora pellucida]
MAEEKELRPREPYTNCLKRILNAYPESSQVLREILQNSDDAQSTEQIFILDHNTYHEKSLLKPELKRFQGPAMLSMNNTKFNDHDFKSLENLGSSEKQNQYDKIGEMGIGFNSIYHLCDSCSFITSNKFAILDPHDWYYKGGVRYDNFATLSEKYPDQFYPFKNLGKFKIPFDGSFDGTIFRYPLRTEQDSKDSKISTKFYNPDKVLEMFKTFFKNDSVNCLLFLRYIERIEFYELKEGKSEPELIYKILLKDAEKVRERRQMIVKELSPMMKNLKENKLIQKTTIDVSYNASIVLYEKEEVVDESLWLILNMLGDLHDAKTKFPNDFGERLGTVSNVGLAAKLNLSQNNFHGKLFCFFPFPINTPFRVSINGHFAVHDNRRDIWSGETEDLIDDSLANLKIKWNNYLFEEVIPQAWVKFIIKLQSHVDQKETYYKFWPIVDPAQFTSRFFRELLKNMVRKINADDKIFREHDQMLSISTGYFQDKLCVEPEILSKIGFPVINAPSEIIEALKNSDRRSSLRFYNPSIVSEFLRRHEKWHDKLERNEILRLFGYLMNDEKYEILEGLKMLPLANGEYKTISRDGTVTYICPDHLTGQGEDDPREIFEDQSEKFIAKDISPDLLGRLIDKIEKGWNFKIEILTLQNIVDMVKNKIYQNDGVDLEWINRFWSYLCNKSNEIDLKLFEDIDIIPTKKNDLRKLKTNQIKYFLNGMQSHFDQIYPILEKLDIIFINSEFENNVVHLRTRFSAYIRDMSDIKSVLSSINTDKAYNLDMNETELFIQYLCSYLHITSPLAKDHIETIKCLPIFKEVGKSETTSLNSDENISWFLLPTQDENDYGQIIAPPKEFKFLDTTSAYVRYLLEDIIKIPRLQPVDYWRDYVIKYLEVNHNKDIVVEKLFERLPRLFFSDHSLESELGNIPIVPCATIRVDREQNLDPIKYRRPIDLYDPSIPKITQLFFDDEQIFPTEKFWDLYQYPLKILGIKTSFSPVDIVERINTYIKRQETIKPNDVVYDKSRNLLIYIDENWNSLKDKNNEFLSIIKYSKWIPTIDKSGNKSFSSSSECRDKKDEHLVSLILSILDYRVESQLREHLEWNRRLPVDIVLEQMKICSKKILNINQPKIPNTPKICEAIYKYINESLSHDDEKSKQEIKKINNELKNIKWIFCKGNFYATENVVFNLSTNLVGMIPIIQLPDDYRNNFSKVFKQMGVREKAEIYYLINLINNIAHEAKNKALNDENLVKTIAILYQIGKECNKSNKKKSDDLKGLLIPSTDAILFSPEEINFDDMAGLNNDEKVNYKFSHPEISLALARELGIQMLSETFIKGSDIDFENYGQSEPLTTKFLQNADDAGAHKFSIYIDERPWHKKPDQSTLLSKEMSIWQGPAIWIYNDAKLDFSSLIRLGIGSKSEDDSKIGRFGIGITAAYFLTDILSFVSGEQIGFLDPHARFLPAQGIPPRRSRGIKLNFLDKKLLNRFNDQCKPYLAVGCDFKQDFNGTLFRLPLRNTDLSKQSLISQHSVGHEEILEYLCKLEGSHEILFLRNIETYNVYHIDKNEKKRLIWEAKIQDLKEDIRDIRSKVDYEPQVFQLDTSIHDAQKNKTTFEVWLVCTGGKPIDRNSELYEFSKNERFAAHGGIAAILTRSDNESLKNPLDLTDPPVLNGKEYAYLPCNYYTNLNVHINGNFVLSKDRMVLQTNNTHGRWNKYILFEVLPPLHVKLLGEIARISYEHFKNSNIKPENFISCITKNFWPFGKDTRVHSDYALRDMGVHLAHLNYYDYELRVLQNLGESKVFWTEAEDGKFVSLDDAYFSKENDHTIASILAWHGISTVKVDKAILYQLKMSQSRKGKSDVKYRLISPAFVYEKLRENNNILKSFQDSTEPHKDVIILLKFILQEAKLYQSLIGFPLVPLKDGSFGTFGERTFYIAKKTDQDLFPRSGPSRFIVDLDDELSRIFEDKDFSRITNIKRLDASGILDLLAGELPHKQEIDCDPSSQNIPNRQWLNNILEKMKWGIGLEIAKLSEYPLLPVILPNGKHKLVQMNPSSPLLICPYNPDEILVRALRKLGICFTDIEFDKKNINSEFLKKGVLNWNYYNVFVSIKKKQKSQNISMESFFKNAELNEDELNKLRKFIKAFINSSRGQEVDNLEVIQELPIWPIHSSRKYEYISAEKGKLPPRNLPCYSSDKDLFDIQDEYYGVLTSLGAITYNEFDYVKQYYTPDSRVRPTQEDIEFLEKILLLKDKEDIMDYLKSFESIPNKNLEAFVKADALYNANEEFFTQIFDENKFLPLKLQNNPGCLYALSKIGLKFNINSSNAYIECASEIESKINGIGNSSDDKIRPIAMELAELIFHKLKPGKELDQLAKIKFVPSKNLPDPYGTTAVHTSGYESFNDLYSDKYQNICWTQAKFFADDVALSGQPPKIEMVIRHWEDLSVGNIFQKTNWESSTIYKIMEDIYQFVWNFLKKEGGTTKLELKNLRFLNGDDPFDPDCWVSGNKLVFGIQNDKEGDLFKVNRRLEPFKELLIAAGTMNIDNEIEFNKIPANHSQKDELIKHLIKCLKEEPNPQYYDVIFEIGSDKIGANRCVLSCVADYFDWEFSVNPIKINNIQPNIYKVLLRWLYGMPYSDAIKEIFGKELSGQDYLDFMLEFLKVSYKYQPLKSIIQNEIVDNSSLINETNVKIIRDLSDEYNAELLKEYCEKYIEKNKDIIDAIHKVQNSLSSEYFLD